MSFILDSVILIDHFNGITQATQFIAQNKKHISISVITRAEVLTGFDQTCVQPVRQLLDQFLNLSINPLDADLAAQLRRQERWKLPDALQAALAQNYHLSLVTRNTRDFPPQRYPFVLVPYML